MMEVINLRNWRRFLTGLESAISSAPEVADQEAEGWTKRTARKLGRERYPPPRPGQRYQRTRKLARGWRARQEQGVRWRIVNVARHRGVSYPRFVVGDRQAWMHQGRWWKFRDVVEAEVPDLITAISDRYATGLERE